MQYINTQLSTRAKSKRGSWTSALVVALAFCVTGTAEEKAEPTSSRYWNTAPSMSVHVGAGLAVFNSSTGWALNFGSMHRISDETPLFVGADLGLNFWSFSAPAGATSSSATAIQLLPSIVYGLELTTIRGVYPYVGLSIGPNVFISKSTVAGFSSSSTKLYFEALVRPGVRIDLNRTFALDLEPKFGILRSEFIFLPQANLVVPI